QFPGRPHPLRAAGRWPLRQAPGGAGAGGGRQLAGRAAGAASKRWLTADAPCQQGRRMLFADGRWMARRPPRGAEQMSITPFRIDIPQAEIDDLKERLAMTRWPQQSTSDWSRGQPGRFIKE